MPEDLTLQHGMACFSALRGLTLGRGMGAGGEPALGRVPGSQAWRQFLASVPAKAERTNTWHWEDYTKSDFTILALACFLSALLPAPQHPSPPPPPRGCWDVGGGDSVSQTAHGAALLLLKYEGGITAFMCAYCTEHVAPIISHCVSTIL